MLRTLRLIVADVRQKATWCYGSAPLPTILKTLATDGTAAMILYRLTQAARTHRMPVVEMVLNKTTNLVGGCVIGRGADFGPGFVLIHSNGVVINGNVRGGSNVLIEHQVTIGADRRQTPVLGSDLFIGAGAKIIGAVTVGDGARIGANAVVVKDVAPNTTVVGIPARPVQRREDRVNEGAAPRADGDVGADGVSLPRG
ncbi:acetyltransferase [Sorangium cellulosum]|uniref:Acetyltransferase n=1 Tax=Sorangium cellulosum TaxID=56 RepID=A0A4P2Q5H3_SORCE|nr:serine acetyltransferase [Sorangium cellulosum]AUX24213.1 acetyltransferase [Sorangium cellulosum]